MYSYFFTCLLFIVSICKRPYKPDTLNTNLHVSFRLLVQIHDELLFEVPDDEIEYITGKFKYQWETHTS